MTEEQKKYLIDLNGMLFFKSEQDKENLEKFIKKDEALNSLGAISYLVKQNLTESQKAQARENIGAAAPGEGGGSGVSDYNKLLNRPIYCDGGYSYFDGDETPNPDVCSVLGNTFYKVSDLKPTEEQMLNADIHFTGRPVDKLTVLNRYEENGEILSIVFQETYNIIIVVYTTETIVGEFQDQSFTITAPSEGIYVAMSELNGRTFEIKYGEIKQLDDIYIQRNIPRLNDKGVLPAKRLPLIPAEKLPSYVDDVVEGYLSFGPFGDIGNFHESYSKDESGLEHWGIAIVPEKGKIYLDLFTNNIYRWSGSQYVRINPNEYTIATNEQILALFN